MNAETVANILWPIWYATWMAAVVFSARTKKQMGTDVRGLHRMLAGFGSILLFFPAFARRSHDASLLDWWTQKLWLAPAWVDWLLLALVQDNPKNKHLDNLKETVELAAMDGKWVSARAGRVV